MHKGYSVSSSFPGRTSKHDISVIFIYTCPMLESFQQERQWFAVQLKIIGSTINLRDYEKPDTWDILVLGFWVEMLKFHILELEFLALSGNFSPSQETLEEAWNCVDHLHKLRGCGISKAVRS